MATGIMIPLSPGELKAFGSACKYALDNYQVDDDTDLLLMLHLRELTGRLAKKAIDETERSIRLSDIEISALWLLWAVKIELTAFTPFEQQTMLKIIGKADHHIKKIKSIKLKPTYG